MREDTTGPTCPPHRRPNAVLFALPIAAFPHTADSHIRAASSIHPYAAALPRGAMHPRCALSRPSLSPHWSISRPVSIITAISLQVMIHLSSLWYGDSAIATGAEKGERTEREREKGGRDEKTRVVRCLAHFPSSFAIIPAARCSVFFSSAPSAGFVAFRGFSML